MNEFYHFYILLADFLDFTKDTIFLHDVLNRSCFPIDKQGQEDIKRPLPIPFLENGAFKKIIAHDDILYFTDGAQVYPRQKNPYFYGTKFIAECLVQGMSYLRYSKNENNALLQ